MIKESTNNNQSLLESIINFSDDAIISKTLDGIITSWNKGAEKMFGYTAEEIIDEHVSVLIPHDLVNEEHNIIEKIKAGNYVEHYETRRVKKDGSIIDVSLSVSPIKNLNGEIIGASKIARDITERVQSEIRSNAANKEIESYKYALDESSIVAITDQKGIIKYVNDNFCKISKYNREELIGQDHRIINSGHHPGIFIRDLWLTIANGRIWKGEMKNKAKDGTYYWVDTTIVPFLNEDGKPYQYVAIRSDITIRKQVEEEIVELTKSLEQKVLDRTAKLELVNKELESFSYSVAHDLRSPLRIIDGYSDILAKEYKDKLDAEGARLIGVIINNTQRMGKLIDELLNLARLGRKELTMHTTDMNSLLNIVITEQTTIAHKPIKIIIGTLLPAVCDSILIRQVWSNLISNAIKYSGKKEDPCIEINATQKDNNIIYSVKDNGVGFNMRYSDKLFGVFQRLHKVSEFEGTGVGLALVLRIVNRHNGSVWAEAKVNEGATFYFSLPIINNPN